MRTLRGISMAVMAIAAIAAMEDVTADVTPRSFKYRTYSEMAAYLHELNATYPDLLRVYVAQDKYGLPYPSELTCGQDETTGKDMPCKHYVVHMTNHSTLAAHPDRPQVFFSGALHGDERIGPATTIEMIALVAKLATVYANPDSSEAIALKEAGGASIHTQRWVHHLVNTRNVVITPMTNAYGYAHNQRTELSVDPNRDYNYMRAGEDCMQTMTSRVINEIWREHMFQLAITFHGGMRAISYEWGSPNHYSPSNRHRSQKSPDDEAQAELSHTLAVFAGSFRDNTLYPTGTMNDIVYGVTGGMEDWGYAASWENNFVAEEGRGSMEPFQPCTPTTFGGFDANKTVYNNVTHRAFNILVETSNNKQPSEDELGLYKDIYNTELDYFSTTTGIPILGHVSQNVRLALMLMDMVQPYVRWVDAPVELPTKEASIAAEAIAANRDLFPSASLFVNDSKQLTSMGCGGFAAESTQIASCNSTNCRISIEPSKPLKLQVAWEVLGAITVDKTHAQLASDASFAADSIIVETTQQKGTTRRFFAFSDPSSKSATVAPPDSSDTLGTSLFVSCLDLHTDVSKKFYVRALATVDQRWRKQAENGEDLPSPHIPPQSHYVNARTNTKWNQQWNGYQVKGSVVWYSPTIAVTIEASSTKATTTPNSTNTTATTSPVQTNSTATTAPLQANATATTAPVQVNATATTAPVQANATITSSPSVSATAPPATTAPIATTSPPSNTPEVTADENQDDDDDNFDDDGVEPELPPTTAPASTKPPSTKPTEIITSTTPPLMDEESLSGVLIKNDAKATPPQNPSLLSYGYLTLGLGGFVIIMTLTYMYKRIFRNNRRTYMSLNQPRSPFARRGPASPRTDDDEDDEDP